MQDQPKGKTLRVPGLPSECPGHCIHHKTWGSQACANTSVPPVPPTPAMMPETLPDLVGTICAGSSFPWEPETAWLAQELELELF